MGTEGALEPMGSIAKERLDYYKYIITLRYYELRLPALIENCLNGESEVELRNNYLVPLGTCPLLLNLIRNR